MSREDNRQRFGTEPLFPLAEIAKQPLAKKFKAPGLPVWTDSKARLIERYLHYFVLVTRHGTYIDGFAGPQTLDVDEYAAKLVLEREFLGEESGPDADPRSAGGKELPGVAHALERVGSMVLQRDVGAPD